MIKKLLLIFTLFICLNNISFAYSENDLSRMEFQKYGRCYEDESLGERISRLENDYLGMTQSGDIEKRIYNLLSVENGNSKYSTSMNTGKSYPDTVKKKSKLKTFWDNISSDFTGMGAMTGFIPPMTTYSNYGGYNSTGYDNIIYNGLGSNNYWNTYHNPYPNAYLNSPFHNNHLYNRGCIHHPHNHHFHNLNPINNRIVNRINNNLFNNRFYNGMNYPYISPNMYQSYPIPMYGNTNYTTRSTVRIIND